MAFYDRCDGEEIDGKPEMRRWCEDVCEHAYEHRDYKAAESPAGWADIRDETDIVFTASGLLCNPFLRGYRNPSSCNPYESFTMNWHKFEEGVAHITRERQEALLEETDA